MITTAAKRKATDRKRIVIIDDHPIVRRGLKQLIDDEPDLMVAGEAEDAGEALRMMAAVKPDVAVVDLSLKESSGLDLIKVIRDRFPNVVILVLSMHGEDIYAERALRAGARGYLTKDEASDKVVTAIRRLLDEGVHVSEKMAERILSKFVHGRPDKGAFSMDLLTDREMEVFECLGHGMTTRQIADRLSRSIKTVESHRENIKHKLKLKNATELLQRAIQWVRYGETG